MEAIDEITEDNFQRLESFESVSSIGITNIFEYVTQPLWFVESSPNGIEHRKTSDVFFMLNNEEFSFQEETDRNAAEEDRFLQVKQSSSSEKSNDVEETAKLKDIINVYRLEMDEQKKGHFIEVLTEDEELTKVKEVMTKSQVSKKKEFKTYIRTDFFPVHSYAKNYLKQNPGLAERVEEKQKKLEIKVKQRKAMEQKRNEELNLPLNKLEKENREYMRKLEKYTVEASNLPFKSLRRKAEKG